MSWIRVYFVFSIAIAKSIAKSITKIIAEQINTQYLLLDVWTSQIKSLWSRFTLSEHREQKTCIDKTIKSNLIEKQESASLRYSLFLQKLRSLMNCTSFLTYNHKDILFNLLLIESWAVNISTEHDISHYAVSILLLRISSFSTLNRNVVQSLFAFRSCLYNTFCSLSFFSMIAKLSSEFTATLSCFVCSSQ